MRTRMRLEHQLPMLIGGVLIAVIVAITVAAYASVRGSALRRASERLATVTRYFRDQIQQNAIQVRAAAAAAVHQPALSEFVRTPTRANRVRALEALSYVGPQPRQVFATELRDSTGAVLLSTDPALGTGSLPVNDVLPRNEPGDSAVVGAFRTLNDTLVYATATPLPGASSVYLVRWRRLVGSRRVRENAAELLGSEASVYLGDPTTGGWTDLERRVPAPRLDLTTFDSLQSYKASSGDSSYLGRVSRIPGTPWAVAVGFPTDTVLAPVKEFERRIEIIGGIALGLGLLIALVASRRLADPLRQLSRAQLETAVRERTAELDKTLTELHDAQETLVRRERLAMLGQLSSGVGHELRNPLGVMTNAVYYLKTVLSSQPDNVQDYLDIIEQQVAVSEKIVADLLDFTRSKPPQRRPTPLKEATEAQLARVANGRLDRVKVVTDIPDALPSAMVDPMQLGQIIVNLVTNATQAMDGSGRIAIRARNGGHRISYEVSDTGPGVKPELLEKIFEPLFTTKARGIGLGLAVSRMLARANGGDLTVTSTPGQGATFLLTLHAATEDDPSLTSSRSPDAV